MATNEYGGIRTGSMEYIKQHLVYDGSSRMIQVYEARANAVNGDTALLTTYAYDGVSTRISDMKETVSTWNSAWDI